MATRTRATRGGPLAGLPKPLRDEVERLGRADIMVGIPSFKNAATIGYVVRAAHAGLVQYFPDLRPILVNADAGSPDGTQRVVVETEPPDYIEEILLVRPRNRLQRMSLTYPEVDGVGGKGAALRTLFRIARALEVQALVVVDSDLRSIGPEWIELLAGPILKGGFDYVTPLYARHKFDGTITNTVTYPLTRALYGLRIRQPIGGRCSARWWPRPSGWPNDTTTAGWACRARATCRPTASNVSWIRRRSMWTPRGCGRRSGRPPPSTAPPGPRRSAVSWPPRGGGRPGSAATSASPMRPGRASSTGRCSPTATALCPTRGSSPRPCPSTSGGSPATSGRRPS